VRCHVECADGQATENVEIKALAAMFDIIPLFNDLRSNASLQTAQRSEPSCENKISESSHAQVLSDKTNCSSQSDDLSTSRPTTILEKPAAKASGMHSCLSSSRSSSMESGVRTDSSYGVISSPETILRSSMISCVQVTLCSIDAFTRCCTGKSKVWLHDLYLFDRLLAKFKTTSVSTVYGTWTTGKCHH
jgi:hypothetical protein